MKFDQRKRFFILVVVTLVVMLLATVLLVTRPDAQKEPVAIGDGVPNATCAPSSAFLVGFESMKKAVVAPIIVLAEPQGDIGNTYRFKITKVLKGSQLSKGDIIDLCKVTLASTEQSDFDPALLLIRGADRQKNVWVTEGDGFGIVGNASGAKFRLTSAFFEPKDYSLKEIQEAIDKNSSK